jgi:hypothetical protein
MRTNRPALCAAQWIIPDTESVDALIEAVLYEQAWWIAVRCGKHAHRGIVWAEGSGRPHKRPKLRDEGNCLLSVVSDQ